MVHYSYNVNPVENVLHFYMSFPKDVFLNLSNINSNSNVWQFFDLVSSLNNLLVLLCLPQPNSKTLTFFYY